MNSELTFITPTYRGDFDRFRLLRESMEVFGYSHIPHYALIPTEDSSAFASLGLENVIPLTTSDLLTPRVEQLRRQYQLSGGRRWKTLKRSLNKRFGWFEDARYYGWQIQQILKLMVPTILPGQTFVSFDSDIVITAKFDPREFLKDGRTVLFERSATIENGTRVNKWYANACKLFDLPVPSVTGDILFDYVSHPFVFDAEICRELIAWIEGKYRRPWFEVLLEQPLGAWSEFTIYGVFVRFMLSLDRVFVSVANENNLWIDTESQRENAARLIREVFDDPQKRFLVLQADHSEKWPVSKFESIIRRELERERARGIVQNS